MQKKQIERFILKKEDVAITLPLEFEWTKYGKAKKND